MTKWVDDDDDDDGDGGGGGADGDGDGDGDDDDDCEMYGSTYTSKLKEYLGDDIAITELHCERNIVRLCLPVVSVIFL